jgi:hypothetical protein
VAVEGQMQLLVRQRPLPPQAAVGSGWQHDEGSLGDEGTTTNRKKEKQQMKRADSSLQQQVLVLLHSRAHQRSCQL